ncbi:hexitol phosphatase HxpB [bacterium]|nr:hexitol phosphatase HxpB [bacterium]
MRPRAAIFDLDGLLIDSEPLWQRAEVEIFNAYGVPLKPEMCYQTVGRRIHDVVEFWHARYPWEGPPPAAVAERIIARMLELIAGEAEPMPGALSAVEALAQAGLPLAVATSSQLVLAEAALKRLGIGGYFEAVCSAQHEPYGKPHPAVYLTAAGRLGVPPEHCLVFEDSVNGLIAAKAAGMYCVAVPYPAWRDNPRFVIADEVLASLAEVTADWLASR